VSLAEGCARPADELHLRLQSGQGAIRAM